MISHRVGVNCAWRLGLAALALLAGFLWYKSGQGWTSARIEREIRASLPLGSHRRQIESWLESKRFEHWVSKDVSLAINYTARDARIDSSGIHYVIMANVANPNVGLFCYGEITILFFMNDRDSLVAFYVDAYRYDL
jgi:hypothetical protein